MRRPLDLPAEAPAILDSQRSQVLAAEAALEHRYSPWGVAAARAAVEAVTSAADVPALTVQVTGPGSGVEYRRADAVLGVGEDATPPAVLHELAHHLTDPAFPAHGAEWVQNFLGLLERFVGVDAATAYRAEFDRRKVHRDPVIRIRRVRKHATGRVNKEPGVLMRVVLDDPPESLLCRLLAVDRGGLSVLTAGGERYLPNDRLRYGSCALSEDSS